MAGGSGSAPEEDCGELTGCRKLKREIQAYVKKADQWIKDHQKEFIEEIQGLARIPSVSHPEEAAENAPFGPACRSALDRALERGRAYGFDTEDLAGYAGVISMGDRRNAIGLIAHLDVVPVGDGWIYPPFGATYLPEHDALIGRGVDDNKGSAVMALFVMRMLREWGAPLRHGVALYCGTSEENGMHDMKALRERGHVFPKLSLVPDAGFPVNYGQKGSLNGFIQAKAIGNLLSFDGGSAHNVVPDRAECVIDAEEAAVQAALQKLPDGLRGKITAGKTPEGVRLTAAGQSGHAAFPDGGVNAIAVLAAALVSSNLLTGAAAKAIAGLYALTRDNHGCSEGVFYEDELSGPLTLVYTIAHLKDGVLRVGLDCRYPITCPGGKLRSSLIEAWKALGYTPEDLQLSDPYYIPKESPYVAALQQVYHSLTGSGEPPYTMGGGTYSKAVPNAVSFGPGVKGPSRVRAFLPEGHGGAHGRDEALPMEKVYNCARIYVAALLTLDEILD